MGARRKDRSLQEHESIEEWIADINKTSCDKDGDTIAKLWAGYGSIVRIQAIVCGAKRSIIWKCINPPPANGSIGDTRKRESYKNEAVFYTKFANELQGKGVPKSHSVQKLENGFSFFVEDLTEKYPRYADSLSMNEALAALDWLAVFHAHFWGCRNAQGLAKQGSYWYLDTRREEFDRISPRTSIAQSIAKWADSVNEWLKNCPAVTIIHGDFKSENLLLNEEGNAIAAVDFQYCGIGPPMKDVVYFLHTSVDRRVLHQSEKLLDYYYDRLMSAVGAPSHSEFTKEDMRKQYMLCVIDWYRFMLGWGMWGSDPTYTAQVASEGLQDIESLLK